MKKIWLIIPFLMLSGCMHQNPTKLKVDMHNAEGDTLGAVHLTEQSKGVKMLVNLKGLQPGVHSLHIHEIGKCAAPNFKSAGNHFNPSGKQHGLLHHKGAHAGDLPNIIVEEDGTAKAELLAPNVTLRDGKNSLFSKDGTSIIVTAKKDNGMSQPTGNSGKRIVCGVIANKK